MADINVTVDFLQSHSAVNKDRIGVTGFCMGGRVTWLAAASNPHFKAMVPYYGGNINVIWGAGGKSPFELSEGIKCPVLFHFGEKDVNPSAEDMAAFDAELTRLGVEHTFHSCPMRIMPSCTTQHSDTVRRLSNFLGPELWNSSMPT